MDAKKMKKAAKAYSVMCKSLDEDKWKYVPVKEEYTVMYSEYNDEAGDVTCKYFIDAERELVRFVAVLPVVFTQDQYVDATVACCVLNNSLAFGGFSLHLKSGEICFNMANAIHDGVPGKDFFKTFRLRTSAVIHKYAANFQKLQKGEIKIGDMAD